jgi:hypothetical protein
MLLGNEIPCHQSCLLNKSIVLYAIPKYHAYLVYLMKVNKLVTFSSICSPASMLHRMRTNSNAFDPVTSTAFTTDSYIAPASSCHIQWIKLQSVPSHHNHEFNYSAKSTSSPKRETTNIVITINTSPYDMRATRSTLYYHQIGKQ